MVVQNLGPFPNLSSLNTGKQNEVTNITVKVQPVTTKQHHEHYDSSQAAQKLKYMALW
jgi:hypothetical protein